MKEEKKHAAAEKEKHNVKDDSRGEAAETEKCDGKCDSRGEVAETEKCDGKGGGAPFGGQNGKARSLTVTKEKAMELEPLLNFLFIVYNEIEFEVMLESLKPLSGYSMLLRYTDPETLQQFYLGKFFKYDIVLIRACDMGSVNINSAINALHRAIRIFKPVYIFMPGIAASLDDDIKIGDVVIAQEIVGYEYEKATDRGRIDRSPHFRSTRLINLFAGIGLKEYDDALRENILAELQKVGAAQGPHSEKCDGDPFRAGTKCICERFPRVHTGCYLSGEKLLDSAAVRAWLKYHFPEGKALDMEGIGVASASIFNRVYDWAVIKGISDYGDGNKSVSKTERQYYAMRNVIVVLKKIFDDENSFAAETLKDISKMRLRNVMVSGSQCRGGQHSGVTEIFLKKLVSELIVNCFRVVTGYGLGVGPAILYGIFDGCERLGLREEEYPDHFKAFPFPRIEEGEPNRDLESCKKTNRSLLCGEAKVCIFAFGQKLRDGSVGSADGMMKELEGIVKNRALPLPIGCTGGTAREIYEKISSPKGVERYIRPYFEERQKYRENETDVLTAIKSYLGALDKLNGYEIEESNCDLIVEKVIQIVNHYI